jgi:hypothetical protein
MARGGGVMSWAWLAIPASSSSAEEQSIPKSLIEIIALD